MYMSIHVLDTVFKRSCSVQLKQQQVVELWCTRDVVVPSVMPNQEEEMADLRGATVAVYDLVLSTYS